MLTMTRSSQSEIAPVGTKPPLEISSRASAWSDYLRTIRPQHWLKNILVLIPAIAAHQLFRPEVLEQSLLAFLALCFAASAGYVLNDLVDIRSDRKHPLKRGRPIASGAISITEGIAIGLAMLLGAGTLCLFLPANFSFLLLVYLGTTLAYSLWLKRKVVIDVVTLATLYSIRVLCGAVATDISVSFWLFAFAGFFFLHLAYIKRYVEADSHAQGLQACLPGRGYSRLDRATLFIMGAASSYTSVLVLALYINSPETRDRYAHPEALGAMCLLFLYWNSRLWLLARRRKVHHDPLVFVVRDPISAVVVVTALALFWFSTAPPIG